MLKILLIGDGDATDTNVVTRIKKVFSDIGQSYVDNTTVTNALTINLNFYNLIVISRYTPSDELLDKIKLAFDNGTNVIEAYPRNTVSGANEQVSLSFGKKFNFLDDHKYTDSSNTFHYINRVTNDYNNIFKNAGYNIDSVFAFKNTYEYSTYSVPLNTQNKILLYKIEQSTGILTRGILCPKYSPTPDGNGINNANYFLLGDFNFPNTVPSSAVNPVMQSICDYMEYEYFITGIVKDSNGTPINNRTILVYERESGLLITKVNSGVDGKFIAKLTTKKDVFVVCLQLDNETNKLSVLYDKIKPVLR